MNIPLMALGSLFIGVGLLVAVRSGMALILVGRAPSAGWFLVWSIYLVLTGAVLWLAFMVFMVLWVGVM